MVIYNEDHCNLKWVTTTRYQIGLKQAMFWLVMQVPAILGKNNYKSGNIAAKDVTDVENCQHWDT